MSNAHVILMTFSLAVVIGTILVLVSYRLKIPAILLLLVGGVSLGPYGVGLLNPQSFGKDGLKTIVSLAIGLILFEGSLTLEIRDYRKISKEIKGLLSIGVIVTWLLTTCFTICLFPSYPISLCLMASSLVIVTGPTVIGPLLKRIHAKKELTHILHWESILIDPIGVFIALLCYEMMAVDTLHALLQLCYRILAGLLTGGLIGYIVAWLVNHRWIQYERLHQAILAGGIAIFAISDSIAEESGLLSVIIAGLILNHYSYTMLKQVKAYKAQLIEILIGLLFMVLGANLNIHAFSQYGWNLAILVILIMWVVRPINVFFSTHSSQLSLRDKLFLSWVAPRGIVAASMATIVSLNLQNVLGTQAQFIETFTFSIIGTTVVLQASTSYFMAKMLGVLAPPAQGWLIIGGHTLGQCVAKFVQHHNQEVSILDTDEHAIKVAKENGIPAICANALNLQPEEYPELYEIGNILAITTNSALNELICQYWHDQLPQAQLYSWKNLKGSSSPPQTSISTIVWNNIDIRIIIDQEEHSNKILEHSYSVEEVKHPDRVLFYSQNNKLLPFMPSVAKGKCMVLEYGLQHPSNYDLRLSWIISYQQTCKIQTAIQQIVERFCQTIPKLPSQKLLEYFQEQENKQEGLVGDGIAFFHTYNTAITKPMVGIARFLQANSLFNQEIHTLFVIISPQNSPQQHLATIASLSTFLSQSENIEKWKLCKSNSELLELLS